MIMVYGVSRGHPPSAATTPVVVSAAFIGALCLLGNCTAMAGYFIVARRVAHKYPPICLTARTPRLPSLIVLSGSAVATVLLTALNPKARAQVASQ